MYPQSNLTWHIFLGRFRGFFKVVAVHYTYEILVRFVWISSQSCVGVYMAIHHERATTVWNIIIFVKYGGLFFHEMATPSNSGLLSQQLVGNWRQRESWRAPQRTLALWWCGGGGSQLFQCVLSNALSTQKCSLGHCTRAPLRAEQNGRNNRKLLLFKCWDAFCYAAEEAI